MTHTARPDPRGATAEYPDEYSETLGTEFRKVQDALLSDTVSLLTTREPIRLPETARIEETLEAMLTLDHVAVIAVDDEGRLSGVATDRDLLKRARGTDRDAGPTRLGAVMTRHPEAILNLRPGNRLKRPAERDGG